MIKVWNYLEDEFVSNMMKITLPSVKYVEKIYLERAYQPITLELVNEAIKTNIFNNSSFLNYNGKPEFAEKNSHGEILTKSHDKIPIFLCFVFFFWKQSIG